jgi:MFS transporter, DHA2 family, multidrug resistance protein
MSDPSGAELAARYGARYRWYVITATMLGTVPLVLATTIVNVAIPQIMHGLAVGQETVQWLATGFLAATTTTMLASSWVVTHFGQRRAYAQAIWLFVAGSVLGALSPTIEFLIAARVIQGAATGLIQPLAMVTIFTVFPPESRGAATSVFGIGVVLGPALGPLLGGVMVEHFGWRAVFYVTLPVCLVSLALVYKLLPGVSAVAGRKPLDWTGAVLLAAFLVAFLNLSVFGHRYGWGSLPISLCAVVTLLALIGFVWRQLHAAHPLLELAMFSNRRFAAASLVSFAYGLGLFGTVYLVPLFVQTVAGYTPTQSGALQLPPGVVLAVVIGLAGRLTDRHPAHHIVAAGLACFALSCYLFTRAQPTTGFWTLAGWIIVSRIGLGLIIPALNVGAIQVMEPSYLAHASAAINFARQLGGALGVNVLAILLEWRNLVHQQVVAGDAFAQARTLGFHDCFWVVTMIFVLAVIPAWLMRKRRSG